VEVREFNKIDENNYEIYEDTFTYYVNLEKGVVAAVMRDPIGFFRKDIDRAAEKLSKTIPNYIRNYELQKALDEPIRAKATCHLDDVFDLDTGMLIARKKCIIKAMRRFGKVFVTYNNLLDPALSYVEDTLILLSGKINKLEEDVAKN
jgi:hypothetical protein